MRNFLLILMAIFLSGCGISGKKEAVIYDLRAADNIAKSRAGLSSQLIIAEPKTRDFLKGQDIAVRNANDGTFSYLPTARWSDTLPKLIQAQFMYGFENAGASGHVGVPGESLRSDLLLLVNIQSFYLEEQANGELDALVSFSVKIVDDRTGDILNAQNFTQRRPVQNRTAAGMMKALDQALDPALDDAIKWTLKRF